MERERATLDIKLTSMGRDALEDLVDWPGKSNVGGRRRTRGSKQIIKIRSDVFPIENLLENLFTVKTYNTT